jgi:hypothetical protein
MLTGTGITISVSQKYEFPISLADVHEQTTSFYTILTSEQSRLIHLTTFVVLIAEAYR